MFLVFVYFSINPFHPKRKEVNTGWT